MKDDLTIRPAGLSDLASIKAILNYFVAHSSCVWTTTPCSDAERLAWYERSIRLHEKFGSQKAAHLRQVGQ